MNILEHKKWMTNRLFPSKVAYTDEFIKGMEEFIKFAYSQPKYLSGKVIRCPCKICKNMKHFMPDEVNVYIFKKGFTTGYWYWTSYGEEAPSINLNEHVHSSASSSHQGCSFDMTSSCQSNIIAKNSEHVNRYQGMIYDAAVNITVLLLARDVTPYNLPHDMCMTSPYMFLTLIIPVTKDLDIMLMSLKKNATHPTLSVFNYPSRSYGKKNGDIRWLDDKEVDAAQLHVLINYDEVKPFLKFDPQKIVIDGIANCIRSKFELARPLRKKFPESTHEMWFEEFKIWQKLDIPKAQNNRSTRAMNYVIDKGWDFYWGTSECSDQQITEAWGIAQRLDLVGSIIAQPEYNLLSRHKNERKKNKMMRKELDLLMKHVNKKSSSNDERPSQEDNQTYEDESNGESDDVNESDNPVNVNESDSDPDSW
ncbi:putative voltage-gated potassium channel subunit beta [Capsicum chinense]|nr:putative voltage-gated potassium channel subunit beta [Capsicum chinense]